MAKKKRGQGEGTIRQRKDGTWEARYTAGRDPVTNKIIRHSIYGKTYNEVAKKLREALSSLDSGTYTPPGKITVGEWLDSWLEEYARPSVRYSTYKSYMSMISCHARLQALAS